MNTVFPPRYELVSELGRGGGGQVWSVRDRLTNRVVALKALAEDSTSAEMQSLVREAVTLSGLEALGVPRVLRFGRLRGSARAYMVRELVEGRSLLSLIERDSSELKTCVVALACAADQLTGLHRAGLLHGDVKPANIIVADEGTATLVDLGLSAPWSEGGARAVGLTPRYAAPELLTGLPVTVRAEIFALGATLDEILEKSTGLDPSQCLALRRVADRAMLPQQDHRYPSADEFASALRLAADIPSPAVPLAIDAAWPVVGVDQAANMLLSRIATLRRGVVISQDGK